MKKKREDKLKCSICHEAFRERHPETWDDEQGGRGRGRRDETADGNDFQVGQLVDQLIDDAQCDEHAEETNQMR